MPILLKTPSGAWLTDPSGHYLAASADNFVQVRGGYRVANDALNLYELYRGIDAEPDLTAAPYETYSSLPHTTAALPLPAPGATTAFYFCQRKRNPHDMLSQNVYDPNSDTCYKIEIDSTGAVVATKPTAPSDTAIAAAAGGTMRVTAHYYYWPDGDDAADTWLVYLTSNGVDPDPAVDIPVEVAMVQADGECYLSYTTGAYADGLTIKTLVRTRRHDAGPVHVDSSNVTIYTATSDTDGPAAPSGEIAFGEIAEQRQ